jgi:hypothetical protein
MAKDTNAEHHDIRDRINNHVHGDRIKKLGHDFKENLLGIFDKVEGPVEHILEFVQKWIKDLIINALAHHHNNMPKAIEEAVAEVTATVATDLGKGIFDTAHNGLKESEEVKLGGEKSAEEAN